MSGVEIRVRANARQAQTEMNKLSKSMDGINQNAQNLQRTFQRLATGIAAAFAGNAVVRGINRASDSMTSLRNRINLVTQDAEKTEKTLDSLFKLAARSRGSVDAAAETFNRFGLALADSNKPIEELLTVTEAVQKAAVISGSGAESAKAAIIQLGQGLASGQLRGQELNSVLEQMPRLARAIAEGLDIPFGKLREVAAEGKITADAVYDAILAGAGAIDEEFQLVNATVADLGTVMSNELTRAIAKFDEIAGVSEFFKNRIIGLTNVFRFVGENINRWALQVELAFLIVESQAKDFFAGFLDLFSEDFDGEAFGRNLVEVFKSAFATVKDSVTLKLSELIDLTGIGDIKIDLSADSIFSGFEGVYATLRNFSTNVVDIFKGIWSAVVGNSWWTGIFDPAHEENGAAAIGNTSSWGVHLNAASSYIKKWSTSLVAVFRGMYYQLTGSWNNLITDIEENGLSDVAARKIVQPLELAWDKVILNMATAWDNFTVTTLGTKLGLPNTTELETGFSDATTRMSNAFTSLKETIANTPLVVGATVAANEIAINATEIKDSIKTTLEENKELISSGITIALASAFNAGLRKMVLTGGIVGAISVGVSTLGNNENFLQAVEDTANNFATAFRKLAFEGEGDFVSKVGEGIVNIFQRAVEGIQTGLFGESEFADEIGAGVAAALALASAKFVGSKASENAGKYGKKLAGGIVAGLLLADIGKDLLDKLFGDFDTEVKFDAFGDVVEDGVFARMGEALKDVVGNAIGGAIAGFAVGGPWGAAAGGLLAALGTMFLGPELAADINAGMQKAFQTAIDWLKENLQSAFDSITFGLFKEENQTDSDEGKERELLRQEARATSIQTMMDAVEDGTKEHQRLTTELESVTKRINKLKNELDRGESLSAEQVRRNRIQASQGLPAAFATGGYVSGPGTGTSDDIPAMLSNGEYVIKASAVQKLGKNKLDLLNQGILPKFSTGGLVGRARQEIRDSFARGDFALANEIIGTLEELDKLDEVVAGLNEEMAEATRQVAANNDVVSETEKRKQQSIDDFATDFKGELASSLSHAIKTGDFKGALRGLMDSITSRIIDNFSKNLVDSLTKNMDFGTLGSLMGEFGFGGIEGIGSDDPVEKLGDVSGKANDASGGFFTKIFDFLKEGFGSLFTKTKDFLMPMFENFTGFFKDIWGKVSGFFKETFASVFGSGEDGGIFSKIGKFLKDGFGNTFNGLTEKLGGLFKGLGGSITKLLGGLGGGGGGGGIMGIFQSIGGGLNSFFGGISSGLGRIFGMSQGGIVPSTPYSQAGKDSVPAMLMPGEVVLSKKDVANMRSPSSANSSQATFNINVQGDVSRQTRQEIVKMMPEITNGVNLQNRETGRRR